MNALWPGYDWWCRIGKCTKDRTLLLVRTVARTLLVIGLLGQIGR